MDRIIETAPNFSEGRDMKVVEAIVDCFRNREGVILHDYTCDADHNRMVITASGEVKAIRLSLFEAIGTAIERIDLNKHKGVHPRMGAADVVPIIPLRNCTMPEAIEISRTLAADVSTAYNIPVYLYEQSANAPHRINLASVRKGGFEGLMMKMIQPEWKPDYDPTGKPHSTAGAIIMGARKPLIAYNINLNTDDVNIAKAIARKIRASNGGLPALKAMGVILNKEGEIAQVSMNLCDYKQTGIYEAYKAVETEAHHHKVTIRNSELIGLIPDEALTDMAAKFIKLPKLTPQQILQCQ